MLASYPQKDGRLLGTDCADQVTPGTEPWGVVLEPQEDVQMKIEKGDTNIQSFNVQSLSLPNHTVW